MTRIKVCVLGTGRVAGHLCTALFRAGFSIIQVYGRNWSKARELAVSVQAQPIDNLENLHTDAHLYILALSDDAIYQVSESISVTNGLIVHTSGFRALTEIHSKHPRRGVFYPLQTFTSGRQLSFDHLPLFVEASQTDDLSMLSDIAVRLGCKPVYSTEDQRQTLHLAAVFVSNFSNALYGMAKKILEEKGLDFRYLHPLIIETARKAVVMDPVDGQTGPARRKDLGTIEKHMQLLASQKEAKAIYQLMTDIIIQQYHTLSDE
ncbi:MAG: DUF2520 domain-containing protein [Bacteroidales bacterium]|nr:DUF2520 domain-containing protein [Bacteroidales bacterium]